MDRLELVSVLLQACEYAVGEETAKMLTCLSAAAPTFARPRLVCTLIWRSTRCLSESVRRCSHSRAQADPSLPSAPLSPEAIFDIEYFVEKPEAFYALAKELYPGNFKPTLTHYFFRLLHEKKVLKSV